MNSVPATQSGTMDPPDAAPSDTQVVSQSVYDSIIRQNGESLYHGISQTGADGATLMTLHEGDSGHIDLLAEFDSARQQRIASPDQDAESNYDPSDSSPMAAAEYQPEFFPESQRFLIATPGTAVKKSQTPGTSMKTPSVSRNPLAGDLESSGGLLGLSQVFKATQAPSSPLVHEQQPELVSDRPSPNIPIQHPRITNNVSSPLAHSRALFARESSEPNLNYISLKESQSRRDKSLGARLTRSADNMPTEDEIDREFYKESSFVENARRQREIDEETTAQFAALNAPSRSRTNTPTSPEPVIEHVHEDDAIVGVASSEEETEQEEDPGPQVPQSQELPQSSEEDKENYNGPPAAVVGTNSAHDRLSQALALEQSPSYRIDSMPEQGADHNGNPVDLHDGVHYGARSSQVMVKDSQQSPQPSPTPKRTVQDPPELAPPDAMHIEPISDIDEFSPVRRLQSSPPGPRHGEDQMLHANLPSPTKGTHLPQPPVLQPNQDPPHEIGDVQSSHPSEPQNTASSLNKTGTSSGDKSSSMPSRVNETPVHLRPQVSDVARLTSIPETSPNRTQSNAWEGETNGDGLENEDDDLPPMFPAANVNRASQPRPSQSRALSSPIKTIQSQALPQILSSPSGRQRRRLTDIAADVSPQVEMRFHDLGLNFFTAEDEEFNSLVIDGSPTRPRKKRRGNTGQTLHTSDTTLPATPRAQPPRTTARIVQWPAPEKPQSPAAVHVPATTVRKQVKPSRRDENVWEIGSSPQQVIRRRSRSRVIRPQICQRQEQQTTQPRKPENKAPARPVVIHNPRPAPSSELTEVDFDSENMLRSETDTTKSPPTTPRKGQAAPDDRHIAPSQVLAVWMGQKRAYYPATCFGTPLGVSQTKYSVKFEDSLPVEVVKGAVKRLELRVGDAVKVDMRDVPKVTHIVRGFDDKLTPEELARAAENGVYPPTDVFGHTSVIVGPKQRKSLPNAGLASSENVIKVPIARIYLDTILWNQLKDRAFTYQPKAAPQETGSHTPSEKSSLPATPSTRFSRSIYESSGIFAGMAFAVSYKEDEASKNRITRLIMEHGGTVLHEGFTELFEPSSIRPVTTPTKGREDREPTSNTGLRLNGLAENVGFACLIADTHSRREKYMQALALNLPCLSGRWVEDCIARGCVLDWDIYLLPAGDSMYLNGVTKSRVMVPTPPSEARLADTIDARPKLLEGKSVLIVMGRGKAEEKRKAYVFLTFALGAARVQRVPDLETAKALLDSQSEASLPCSWDLIYVDDADQDSARAMLMPQTRTQRIHLVHGKKRKKSATFTMSTPPVETAPTARVIGNEFVCQSLILGRLFEE